MGLVLSWALLRKVRCALSAPSALAVPVFSQPLPVDAATHASRMAAHTGISYAQFRIGARLWRKPRALPRPRAPPRSRPSDQTRLQKEMSMLLTCGLAACCPVLRVLS